MLALWQVSGKSLRANWSLSWLLKKKPRHSWRQWPVCLQWGAFMKGYWHISFLEPQREPLRALGVGYLKTESTTTTPPLPRRGCRSSKSSDLRDLSCFITCAILSSPSVQQIETEVLCGGVCVCVCVRRTCTFLRAVGRAAVLSRRLGRRT